MWVELQRLFYCVTRSHDPSHPTSPEESDFVNFFLQVPGTVASLGCYGTR